METGVANRSGSREIEAISTIDHPACRQSSVGQKNAPGGTGQTCPLSADLFPYQRGTEASLSAIARPPVCIAPQVTRPSHPSRSKSWSQLAPIESEGSSLERTCLNHGDMNEPNLVVYFRNIRCFTGR